MTNKITKKIFLNLLIQRYNFFFKQKEHHTCRFITNFFKDGLDIKYLTCESWLSPPHNCWRRFWMSVISGATGAG